MGFYGVRIVCVLCGKEIRGKLMPARPVKEGICCETCFEKTVKPVKTDISLGTCNGPIPAASKT